MSTTKERPILFSATMVQAILTGRKTQTRRIIGPQPKHTPIFATPEKTINCREPQWLDADYINPGVPMVCKQGKPGDRLWVRETWKTCRVYDDYAPSQIDSGAAVQWMADRSKRLNGPDDFGKTRVSIHMPRWASRITLEVLAVRCERLQEISANDCRAEGQPAFHLNMPITQEAHDDAARDWYMDLWSSINGPDAWDANPWVWVIEFKVLP